MKRPFSQLLFTSGCFVSFVLISCEEKIEVEDVEVVAAEVKPAPSEWLMTRGGKELQGRVSSSVAESVGVAWTFEMQSPGTSEPAVTSKTIFAGDAMGFLYAIDLETREEKWRFETENSIVAAPAVSEDLVIIASSDGFVYGVNRETGEKQWSFEGEDKFSAGPVLQTSPGGEEEWVLVNCYDGTSHCLRLKDGASVWNYNTGYYLNGSSAVIENRLLVFGGCDAFIYGVNIADGEPVHQVETSAQITNSGAISNGVMYCGNHASEVVAADVVNEKLLWTYEAGEFPFESAPALDDNRVYIGSDDKNMHAIDRETGELAWKFRTGGSIVGAPLAFDDAVVFGSKDGRLYAVNSEDGSERWRLDLGEGLEASPAYANGRIVIAGSDGTVFVVGPQ